MSGDQGPTRRDFLASLTASVTLAGFSLPRMSFALSALEQAPAGAKIVAAAIYPPIGISRVGSSPEWFLAPELPGRAPDPGGSSFKDTEGRIKKQVQRFRVYGFDEQGRLVRELTADDGTITWNVHVANSKADWYGYNNPMNLGDDAPGIPAMRRNAGILDADERTERLIIDAGKVPISGASENENGGDAAYQLAGSFWSDEIEVKLGELRTDAKGRLLVVPADGVSASAIPDNPIVDFTKNDAWYDDWCDGWVKATIQLGDSTTIEAAPGWVACCGPNFAPEIDPLTSLYDTIFDAMLVKHDGSADAAVSRPKGPLSFSRDIYPIFYRLGTMQWVSAAAAQQQGWIRVGNFADPAYIKLLAKKNQQALHEQVYEAFRRRTDDPGELQYRLPYMLGSGVDYTGSPDFYVFLSDHQYWILDQWLAGNYDNDYPSELKQIEAIESLDDLPTAEQPDALTQAALLPCSGGNFHPGVELTWVLGQPELFDERWPFRIKLGNRASLNQNLGRLITPDNTLPPSELPPEDADQYPVGPQMPGDLTRWMGLPWQPDAFSCQNVNFANDFPTIVWWPALLPVDIMPEYSYQQMLRTDLSRDRRMGFAATRAAWARGASGIGYHANAGYFDGLNRMVYLWERMGFVVRKPTPKDLQTGQDGLPPHMFVEVDRGSMDLMFDAPPNLGLPGPE